MGFKRKRHFNKDQPNLKRFREDVIRLTKSKVPNEQGDDDKLPTLQNHSTTKQKHEKGRKEKRRDAKKLKKMRRLAYSQHQQAPRNIMEASQENVLEKAKKRQEHKEKVKEKKKKLKEAAKAKKKEEKTKVEEIRKRQMEDDIKRDEKMLKQLGKQLHLNKRKSKNLPQSFMSDGLDYILDAVDEEKVRGLYNNSDSEEESDLDIHPESNSDMDDEDAEWLKSKKKTKIDKNTEDDDDIDESDIYNTHDSKYNKRSKIESEILHSIRSIPDGLSILKMLKSKKADSKTVTFRKDTDEGSGSDDSEDEIVLTRQDDNDLTHNTDKPGKSINTNIIVSSEEEQEEENDDEEEKKNYVEEEEEEENYDDEEEEDNDDDYGDDEEKEEEERQKENSDGLEGKPEPTYKEDIYGRLRDERGNIVNESKATQSYIPPGKRLQMTASTDQKSRLQIERLKKQLKGLINRVSSSNIGPISSQIEDLYRSNSRANVNETLSEIIMDACITAVMTPERLAMELMMLLTILHGNVGSEVGAVIAQCLAEKFESLCAESGYHGEGKEVDNIVLLFCYLYNFKVIHDILIFDLVNKFVKSFKPKDMELLILILKNVGFSLRRDNPAALKETIQHIQTKASSTEYSDYQDSSRVQFMLETMLAIKNNNMRKIPNYDPEHFEQLKKQTRFHLRGSTLGSGQLKISLDDLINAKDKGRWWVIGSAWEGREENRQDIGNSGTDMVVAATGEMNAKIADLARKQRMNTDVRRSIFSVIMSSEDFVDAFEKLLRLGLKNQSEREIIHVLLHCCQQEKTFNPFYAFLMQKFCEYDRRFQMTFQFTMWDKFKEMSNLPQHNRENLAKLTSHLLATKAISLSMFKVVEFGTLDKVMVRFLKDVLQGLLLDKPDHVIESVFSRIAPLHKLKMLQEGLKLFMHHFILRKKSTETKDYTRLKESILLAEKAISSGQSKMML